MSTIINPWDLGEKVTSGTIPSFVQGRFVTVKLGPPKGKTVREGLVSTLALISYKTEDGEDIVMTQATKTGNNYDITFPLGKRGIMATKYRGPKSWYTFVDNRTGEKYMTGKNDPVTKVNNKLTLDFINGHLSKNIKDWNGKSEAEKDDLIDQYYSDFYMYGLAKDYNLEVEADEKNHPYVGLVTEFYRRYTPPKEGERFGNVIVTKFAPRDNKPNLSGDHSSVDAEVAAAIYTALTTTETSNTSFDPTDVENSEDDII